MKIFRKYNAIILIFIIIFIPFIFLTADKIFSPAKMPKWMRSNWRLNGKIIETKNPCLNKLNFYDRNYQLTYENWFNQHFPLRSLFIRIHNQFQYNLFKKSYSDHGNIIIGKENDIFEIGYILSVCFDNINYKMQINSLENWAKSIKELQDQFENLGQKFFYVITPSKGETNFENIPDRFHCKNKKSNYIELFTKALKKERVNLINTHSMVLNLKNRGDSIFPKGGGHWNEKISALATEEIIKNIRASGLKIPEFTFVSTPSMKAESWDHDILGIVNLLFPNKNYFTYRVSVNPSPNGSDAKIAMIGGSFLHKIRDMMIKSKIFSRIDHFYYYKIIHYYYDKEINKLVENQDIHPDEYKAILNANVVILEENIVNPKMEHALAFYELVQNHLKLNEFSP